MGLLMRVKLVFSYVRENPHIYHCLLTLLQTEQTQIRQLLQELPDQSLLCLLMET